MTIEEAVAAIDAMKFDPEACHGDADEILVAMVPPEVAAAYRRLQGRMPWWACA